MLIFLSSSFGFCCCCCATCAGAGVGIVDATVGIGVIEVVTGVMVAGAAGEVEDGGCAFFSVLFAVDLSSLELGDGDLRTFLFSFLINFPLSSNALPTSSSSSSSFNHSGSCSTID